MVFEVVSESSVEKDMVDLPEKYWRAGVIEYWVIDARDKDAILFELLKRGTKGFVQTRKQVGGWMKSEVFGRSFRLTHELDEGNDRVHTLELK